MTTKKTTKAVTFNAMTACGNIGENLGRLASAEAIKGAATEAINADCKAMRAAKIKLGKSRKTCQYSAKIYDSMPSTLAVGTRNNMLTEIRKAINEGKAFSHNPGRKTAAAKKKGAKASGGTIMIAIAAGDKPEAAADKLRKGFNKIKAANDGLAELAAYLLDALDDAGFAGDDE